MGKWVHRLSEIDEEKKIAVCANCGPVSLTLKSGRWKCSVARLEQKGNETARSRHHGLRPAQVQEYIAERGNRCEICGRTDRRLYVDHSHATGLRRGVLCRQCNTGLGQFGDSPDMLRLAIKYLAR